MAVPDWTAILTPLGLEAPGYQEHLAAARERKAAADAAAAIPPPPKPPPKAKKGWRR